MLLRTWTVLRTITFFVVTAYALWAMPWMSATMPRTLDEQYARCAATVPGLQRAAWLAIAWIALEAVIGWIQVWRAARAAKAAAAPPAGPPPAR
jgi:hypothetical protein